jgi:four helix bundle protein
MWEGGGAGLQKTRRLKEKATPGFPKEEMYGLTSQIRQAGASIPASITEGCWRGGNAELVHFLQIAMGSANELEYHLLLAHDLEYLSEKFYQDISLQLSEGKRMLDGLIQKI